MSENVKLPRDVAEYQRELRKAYTNGALWIAATTGVDIMPRHRDQIERAANFMFPIPEVTE